MGFTRAPHYGMASRLLVAVASLWLPCACAAADIPVGAEAPTIETIRALIGDAACDSDAQCRTIAVGAKACGGPEAYVAWSTRRTEAAALQDAVASYNAAQQREVVRRRLQSDCSIVADPGAYCAPSGSAGTGLASQQGRACRLRSVMPGGRGPVD